MIINHTGGFVSFQTEDERDLRLVRWLIVSFDTGMLYEMMPPIPEEIEGDEEES